MPEADDPMEAIKRLGERVKETLEPLGLDLKQFFPMVDFEHDAHMIQAVFLFNAPVAAVSEEQAQFDEQFKELEKQFVSEKEDDKNSDAAERMLALRKRLREGKSLLDDGDDGPVST